LEEKLIKKVTFICCKRALFNDLFSQNVPSRGVSACKKRGVLIVKKDYTLLILMAALLTTTPVYAYLDGGTGSILIQGLFAGIAGALAFLKIYWSKLKSLFKGAKRKETLNNTSTDHD
jgi:hypothetical protein